MNNYTITYSNELYHHGILGQKWGVRNGPPYPLSSGDHSASEKKAGWKKSLNNSGSTSSVRRKLNPSGIVNAGKVGAKYDFSKDNNPGANAKALSSTAYSFGKQIMSNQLSTIAKAGVQALIDSGALAESVANFAGPAATIATKVAIEGGERIANKILTTNEKKRLDEIRKDQAIDPETGLHLKSANDNSDDVMAVNPKYHNDTASIGATSNCYRCTVAYDLRKRGYDVSAGLTLSGVNPRIASKILYGTSKYTKGKGSLLGAYTKEGNVKLAKDMVNKLSSQPDSRGQLAVYWPFGGGHSMAYEVNGGKVTIIDAQTGHKYTGQDVEDVFASTTGASFMRLDNLEPNKKALKRYVI